MLSCLPILALALSTRLPASPRIAPAPLGVPASTVASELASRTVTAWSPVGAPLASTPRARVGMSAAGGPPRRSTSGWRRMEGCVCEKNPTIESLFAITNMQS